MRLDCPALLAREVLQTATCGIERLVNGNAGVAMNRLDLRAFVMCVFFDVSQSAVQRRFVVDDYRYAARNRDLDSHVEVPPIAVMPVWKFDENAAPDNAIVELLQPRDALMNV
jgi:hypothetical protein